MRARCFAVAAAGTALVLLWLALTVRYNYGGNWTGLFCTGANQRVPADLLAEKLYTFPASSGYDGQFYHYIAHDPLGRTQLPNYIDAPQLRYRRILVPALAYLIAVGQGRFIDAAYLHRRARVRVPGLLLDQPLRRASSEASTLGLACFWRCRPC